MESLVVCMPHFHDLLVDERARVCVYTHQSSTCPQMTSSPLQQRFDWAAPRRWPLHPRCTSPWVSYMIVTACRPLLCDACPQYCVCSSYRVCTVHAGLGYLNRGSLRLAASWEECGGMARRSTPSRAGRGAASGAHSSRQRLAPAGSGILHRLTRQLGSAGPWDDDEATST